MDPELGNVCTRFFGHASGNLWERMAWFTKAIAFMSDTANVMKGRRSGVHKLIKSEIPQLYDVGCICHLADLAIKAGVTSTLHRYLLSLLP